jgi:toxin ParE1/3/4
VSQVELTSAAKRDLNAIWSYIAADNLSAADRVVRRIDHFAQKLSRQAGIGVRCDHLAVGLRQFPVRPFDYVIFYRPIDDGIRIIRVLHGRRDIAGVFQNEPPDG